jgi:hypothetical protein
MDEKQVVSINEAQASFVDWIELRMTGLRGSNVC